MFWSLLQNLGGKGITFLVMIILARILTPEIFGLVGMIMIFIQLSQTLVQAGFNQALIQKQNADEEDFSSVFWINLLVSLIIYIGLYLASPWIADFYEQEILSALTRAFGLVFVINAFSYVQEARLSKTMQFKTLAIINIPSTIIGGTVSIVMAILGNGVWSIIALQIVTRLAYTIQIWIYAKWRPLFKFNKVKAQSLFSFGWKLMLSGVLNTVFQNSYKVIIGKFFPLSMVGFYENADNLVRVPSNTFTAALKKVLFPAFSNIQEDNQRLKIGLRKINQQVLFWVCPVFTFAAVLGEPLFYFLFGDKWVPAVPYFQWLCIVGIFIPVNSYNLNIVNVKGRSDIFLTLGVIKNIFTVIGIFLAIPFGIEILLLSQVLTYVLFCLVNAFYSGKFIKYSVVDQITDITPILVLSVISGTLVFVINQQLELISNFVRLLLGFMTGGGVYGLLAFVFKIQPWMEFKDIIDKKFSSSLFIRKK